MPVNLKNLAKKIGIGAAAAGGVAGAGYGGYQVGKHKGAKETANEMARAFSEANAIENQQIAKTFYRKGLEERMDKKANLETIYKEAFDAEIDKIAAKVPGLGKKLMTGAKEALETVKGSFGHLGQASKAVFNPTAKTKATSIMSNLKKSKAALGIIGGGAAAGIGGGAAAVGSMNSNKND